MIGYEFHNMVLTGDNSVRGTHLFAVGSIWKDKKTLGNSVSTCLSLTGREMVSEKTTFHCSRCGMHRRNKIVPKNKEIIEEDNSEQCCSKRKFKSGDLKI